MFGAVEQNGDDNFKLILSSIKSSLESKNYVAALGMALTIPDICGNLEYPNKRTGDRYKSWYINYVECEESKISYNKYTNEEEYPEIIPNCDAETVYKLRCSFLHAGQVSSEYLANKFKKESKNLNFEFVLIIPNEAGHSFNTGQISEDDINGSGKKKLELVINVEELCQLLIEKGAKFHEENSSLFSEFTSLSMLENEY